MVGGVTRIYPNIHYDTSMKRKAWHETVDLQFVEGSFQSRLLLVKNGPRNYYKLDPNVEVSGGLLM